MLVVNTAVVAAFIALRKAGTVLQQQSDMKLSNFCRGCRGDGCRHYSQRNSRRDINSGSKNS